MKDYKELKGYDGIFATRLRELLKQRRVTQKDVAEQTNSKRQTISLYINGQVLPNAERLRDIALFLNVSADYLVGLSDIPNQQIDKYEKEIVSCRALIKELQDKSTQFITVSEKIFRR